MMNNPEVFQGEKYLDGNKDYFEGWYFKNIGRDEGISFIPGISISSKEKRCFIQVITNDSSWFIDFDINDFEYSHKPFYIKIDNNFFSKDRINIDINDNAQNLKAYVDIKYTDGININTNLQFSIKYKLYIIFYKPSYTKGQGDK